MSRALVTLAKGPHERLLEVALPSFRAFADRHGYEVIVASESDHGRPPSWWKVLALKAALWALAAAALSRMRLPVRWM